jgi:hypothetical protein
MNYCLLALLSMVVAVVPSGVYAASNIYQCQIMSDAHIRYGGALEVMRDSPRIGQKFTVIKNNGRVIGDVMDDLKNPKVAALGSEKNSYKVIWEEKAEDKNGAFVDYLSIDESAKGRKKPFGFFSGSLLLTGLCE